MTVTMQVERPEDVRVTLTTTMTVAQWGVLIGALTEAIQGPQGHWQADICAFRDSIENWQADICAFRDSIENAVDAIKTRVNGEPREV